MRREEMAGEGGGSVRELQKLGLWLCEKD